MKNRSYQTFKMRFDIIHHLLLRIASKHHLKASRYLDRMIFHTIFRRYKKVILDILGVNFETVLLSSIVKKSSFHCFNQVWRVSYVEYN